MVVFHRDESPLKKALNPPPFVKKDLQNSVAARLERSDAVRGEPVGPERELVVRVIRITLVRPSAHIARPVSKASFSSS